MNGVPTMKILLCILLLSASLLSPALSLTCYVCSSTETNEECNKDNQTCPEPLDTCMTIVDVLGISKSIVKLCASRATCLGAAANGMVDEDGNGSTINCCSSSSFCNHSGAADAARVHAALWLLPLLGLLLLSH